MATDGKTVTFKDNDGIAWTQFAFMLVPALLCALAATFALGPLPGLVTCVVCLACTLSVSKMVFSINT